MLGYRKIRKTEQNDAGDDIGQGRAMLRAKTKDRTEDAEGENEGRGRAMLRAKKGRGGRC